MVDLMQRSRYIHNVIQIAMKIRFNCVVFISVQTSIPVEVMDLVLLSPDRCSSFRVLATLRDYKQYTLFP